mgnify:CR=1 FL=1
MEKNVNEQKKGIMPKVARSLGEKSVSTFCFWWFNQLFVCSMVN